MERNFKFAFLFLINFMLFSCSTADDKEILNEEINLNPSLTVDYFNLIMKKNNLGNDIVKQIEKFDSKKLESMKSKFISKSVVEYSEDNSISVQLEVNKILTTFHILPRINEPHKADLYFERDGVLADEVLEIAISVNPEAYNVQWKNVSTNKSLAKSTFSKNNNKNSCEDGIISCDCEEGASDVMTIGGVIAFAGFFACVPCPFVGGAVATVAGVISLTC